MDYPKASRNTDPESSHLAEYAINRDNKRHNQCMDVLAAIREYPGSTSVELSIWCKFDRHMVSRRTADLFDRHLVTKGEQRKCSINNRQMMTWKIIERDPTQIGLFE